jgi:hypothetical protein
MEQIKINPMKTSERERLNKLYKIGPYREWEIDIKRIAEINKLVLAGEVTMHPVTRIKTGHAGRKPGGTNSIMGKRQWERKQEQLIHELNNG